MLLLLLLWVSFRKHYFAEPERIVDLRTHSAAVIAPITVCGFDHILQETTKLSHWMC